MKTKINEKGQMVIPSRIRNFMGLKTGEEMLIFAMKNEMIVKAKIVNPLEKAGMLGRDDVENVKDLILRYKTYKVEI